MNPQAIAIGRDDPMPAGFAPLVQFVLPDGTKTTTRNAAKGLGARPPEQILAQIRTNAARALPVVRGREFPHERTMVLACFGSSLRQTWPQLDEEKGDLWTVSGAHSFLVEKGLTPHAYTHVDPRADQARMLTTICPSTRFYLPSRTDPLAFERLREHNVILYHINCKKETDTIKEEHPDAFFVPTAITSGLVALQLGLVLGYRHFRIYGMDGSADPHDKARHAFAHLSAHVADQFTTEVEIEGRHFLTNMLMLLAVDDFFAIAVRWPVGTFEFVGDGMLPWIEKVARRAHK